MNDIVNPLVSVVIPTYNHARYLGRALQSVLDQTYSNWEAIVIDNHSTDNTDEVMASFSDPRISYLKIRNNGVIAASRNAGIRAAKGEWVAFLDSDDWWTSDKLQVCFGYFNGKVDLVYHDLEIISDKPRIFRRKRIKSWQVKEPVLMDLMLRGNAISNSSVVVRNSLLEKIGGINESREMIAAEDYNTWLRIAQFTNQFVYLPRRLGYYLQHNNNISQKDMSPLERRAIAEFLYVLNEKLKNSLVGRLDYSSGRFNYLVGNHAEAKNNFKCALNKASHLIKAKALLMIIKIYCNPS